MKWFLCITAESNWTLPLTGGDQAHMHVSDSRALSSNLLQRSLIHATSRSTFMQTTSTVSFLPTSSVVCVSYVQRLVRKCCKKRSLRNISCGSENIHYSLDYTNLAISISSSRAKQPCQTTAIHFAFLENKRDKRQKDPKRQRHVQPKHEIIERD